MKTTAQKLSSATLFAAGIGCLIQTATGIFILLSPYFFANILSVVAGKETAMQYMMYIASSPYLKNPMFFMAGLILTLLFAVIFLYASRNIKRNRKTYLWAVLSLIISLLLTHFGMPVTVYLGLIGSVSGLMAKEDNAR